MEDVDACVAEEKLGVVARRRRLDDRRLLLRLEPGEEHRRLHLRAGNRERVVDPVQRSPLHRERQVAVGRLDTCAHPLHRPAGERVVAGERERAVLPREDPCEQADERARIPAVDRTAGRVQAREAAAAHHERVHALLGDLHAERAHRGDRRLRVGRAPETGHGRLVVAERGDEDGAVGDRLVPGHGHVPDETRDRLDVDGLAHSSITGAATTP